MDKTVTIRLPKGAEHEEADVFVGVNGKGWRVRKGVEVTVPVFVAEVLHNAEQALDRVEAFVASNAK